MVKGSRVSVRDLLHGSHMKGSNMKFRASFQETWDRNVRTRTISISGTGGRGRRKMRIEKGSKRSIMEGEGDRL